MSTQPDHLGPPLVSVVQRESFQFMRETTLDPSGRVSERWCATTAWETSDNRFRPRTAGTNILSLVAGLLSKGLAQPSTSSQHVPWVPGGPPPVKPALSSSQADFTKRIGNLLRLK